MSGLIKSVRDYDSGHQTQGTPSSNMAPCTNGKRCESFCFKSTTYPSATAIVTSLLVQRWPRLDRYGAASFKKSVRLGSGSSGSVCCVCVSLVSRAALEMGLSGGWGAGLGHCGTLSAVYGTASRGLLRLSVSPSLSFSLSLIAAAPTTRLVETSYPCESKYCTQVVPTDRRLSRIATAGRRGNDPSCCNRH